MKKRQMVTVTQIVQIWRMIYMERKTGRVVAEKTGLKENVCYGAYRILTSYLRGENRGKKFHSYVNAARLVKEIIRNEIDKPKQKEAVVAPAQETTPPPVDPADAYTVLASAMKALESAIEGVIAYNAQVERERITKIMEEAKYTNWSASLKSKFGSK